MRISPQSVNPTRKSGHDSLYKSSLKGYSFLSNGVNDTLRIGRTIARNLKKGDIICLFGELGSGKTVLTKGIAWGLRIKSRMIISPSFVLIRQYNGPRLPLYHFDLYRLKEQKDILSLGYEEYLYDEGVTVIEWADRLKSLIPNEYLKIELLLRANTQRLLKFSGIGERYKELLGKVYEDISH